MACVFPVRTPANQQCTCRGLNCAPLESEVVELGLMPLRCRLGSIQEPIVRPRKASWTTFQGTTTQQALNRHACKSWTPFTLCCSVTRPVQSSFPDRHQTRPVSCRAKPEVARFGRRQPNFCRPQSKWAQLWPNPAQHRRNWGQSWPTSARVCRFRLKLQRIRAECGRNRPNSGEIRANFGRNRSNGGGGGCMWGQMWSDSVRSCPHWGQLWPKPTQVDPIRLDARPMVEVRQHLFNSSRFGQDRLVLGPIRAKFGRIRSSCGQAWWISARLFRIRTTCCRFRSDRAPKSTEVCRCRANFGVETDPSLSSSSQSWPKSARSRPNACSAGCANKPHQFPPVATNTARHVRRTGRVQPLSARQEARNRHCPEEAKGEYIGVFCVRVVQRGTDTRPVRGFEGASTENKGAPPHLRRNRRNYGRTCWVCPGGATQADLRMSNLWGWLWPVRSSIGRNWPRKKCAYRSGLDDAQFVWLRSWPRSRLRSFKHVPRDCVWTSEIVSATKIGARKNGTSSNSEPRAPCWGPKPGSG